MMTKKIFCSFGYHIVRGHYRLCRSGIVVWVHEHIARNPGHQKNLDLSNSNSNSKYSSQDLRNLFQNSKKKYSALGGISGFPPNSHLDDMIQFWLDYWKNRDLKFPDDLTPRLIKAMIAKESSFNPKAHGSKLPTAARGLMQILKTTREHLDGSTKELRNELLSVSQDDLFDPMINIACGIRWLARKYVLIPKNAEKNAFNTIKAYNQWNAKGEAYAKEIFKMASKKFS